jgi:hypothetical protein
MAVVVSTVACFASIASASATRSGSTHCSEGHEQKGCVLPIPFGYVDRQMDYLTSYCGKCDLKKNPVTGNFGPSKAFEIEFQSSACTVPANAYDSEPPPGSHYGGAVIVDRVPRVGSIYRVHEVLATPPLSEPVHVYVKVDGTIDFVSASRATMNISFSMNGTFFDINEEPVPSSCSGKIKVTLKRD